VLFASTGLYLELSFSILQSPSLVGPRECHLVFTHTNSSATVNISRGLGFRIVASFANRTLWFPVWVCSTDVFVSPFKVCNYGTSQNTPVDVRNTWRYSIYKVVQIWPGRFVCKQVTVCPGHIWTTLYQRNVVARSV
jgi:hypothetical protein